MKWKKFLIGLAIFIVTIIFIVFANRAINPEPKYQSCPYNYNIEDYNGYLGRNCQSEYDYQLKSYKETGFLIVTALSVLAIIAGVLVRTVAPVSWGLGLSGLVMILYIFIANYEEVGKPYRAILSGIALAVLIWLAYAKLGDKEKMTVPPVSTTPPTGEVNENKNGK